MKNSTWPRPQIFLLRELTPQVYVGVNNSKNNAPKVVIWMLIMRRLVFTSKGFIYCTSPILNSHFERFQSGLYYYFSIT